MEPAMRSLTPMRPGTILPGAVIGEPTAATFNVSFTVGSADGRRALPLSGMIDTGSLYSIIPASLLDGLGIARDEPERFVLADGSILEMPIGLALLEMDGRARTVHVAFGPDDNIIVVGAMTLERFGVAVDPVRQRLIPATITM